MLQAIIFDMDGTILNTIDDIAKAVNVALEYYKYPLKSVDDVKAAVGHGAMNLIINILPKSADQVEIKKVYDKYQSYYDTHNNIYTAPYPEIIEVLKGLKKKYKLAVVSNKHEYIVKELNHEVFEDIFDVAIGQIPDIPIKPAPDMLYKALKELDVEISHTVFIGDSDVDIKTARNANISSIGVTWGFRNRKVLEQEQATYIIDHPKDLLELIERIKNNGNH